MSGKSTEKTVIHAVGKVDGKTRQWVVAVFNDVKTAQPYVNLLRLAYQTGNEELVKQMDPHAVQSTDGKLASDVKFSKSIVQYSPSTPSLDDETLG